MNKLDKKNLEEKFAEDFATKYFRMISNIYFLEGDLKRARKVCEIGLQYNPNNTDGLFILSKIELLENNNIEAEKNLKKIIKKSPGHINALQSLIKVSEQLKRSEQGYRQGAGMQMTRSLIQLGQVGADTAYKMKY